MCHLRINIFTWVLLSWGLVLCAPLVTWIEIQLQSFLLSYTFGTSAGFGPPWAEKVTKEKVLGWHESDLFSLECFDRKRAAGFWSRQYLVLLCSRGESVDLWAQLNKHLCDSPDPVMKSSVFIVLGTEVVLILLTLLQCCDGAVFSEKWEHRLLLKSRKDP